MAHLFGALLLAWTLVLALCFFFSPVLGCFLFIKFGRVSSFWFLLEDFLKIIFLHGEIYNFVFALRYFLM